MKTRNFKIPLLTLAAVAGSVLLAGDIVAQDATVVNQPTTAIQSMPRLAYGSAQILQMVQAKVGESTILAYIQNSNLYFPLDASQIIYLKQQGASNAILDAMLNHQGAGGTSAAQTSANTAQSYTAVAQPSTAAPSVTYVQSTPSPVYVSSYPYYYPYYGYYPYYSPISLSFGFGGYYGGGYYGGWRGGYYGGWHGSGWGGGWHGSSGGGWHH
jgi:hypothetical protein